jgi:drug/metabolite transporter (DMT)-like permease
MTSPLGAAAAVTASATWAYASTRYAIAAREVSPVRVNLTRMLMAWPVFVALGMLDGSLGRGLAPRNLGWLALSTFCSYAFADSLFFAAARRIGASSALAIASTYPLWAALKGTLVDGEAFGLFRALGTLCCVGGVAAIVKLSDANVASGEGAATRDRLGVPLALITSVLWAGNTISIKAGSVGLSLSTVNAFRYGLAICVLSGFVVAGRAPGATRPPGGWRRIVPAVVLDCLFGSMCFIYGLGATDLAVGSTLSSLAPVLSLPFALWLGAERLTAAKLAAVATTVAGVALLAW